MVQRVLRIILPVVVFSLLSFASEQEDVIVNDSSSFLLTTNSTSRMVKGDSTIYLYFNFNDSCPNFFYEILLDEKKVVFTFVNTRLGGFTKEDTIKHLNLGPIKTMYLNEQIKDKNEAVTGLVPELYYVTNMTLICDPVIQGQESFDIIEKDQTLSIILEWPKNKVARKKLFYNPQKKKKSGLIFTLTGIGVAGLAGGGYFLWHFLNGDANESDILQPVLPEHPAP